MGIRNRDHERPAPSLLSDDPRGEGVKLHERDRPGRDSGGVVCRGVLWTKCRNIYTASAAAFEGLRQLQSSSINARKRIVRAWDDVAVKCGDLVWIPDGVKDSSTRDKPEIAQKPEKISLPLVSFLRAFDLCQFSASRFHIWSGRFPQAHCHCFAGHTSRKRFVLEENRYRKRQGFLEEVYFLVKHGFLIVKSLTALVFPF